MTFQPGSMGRAALAPAHATLRREHLALLALAIAPFFWTAWQIRPLYTENQNTKFLHALADAGVGLLREDWMAQTKDGLPAFTMLSELIYRVAGPAGFYIACWASFALFLFCALTVYRRLTSGRNLPLGGLAVYLAMLFFLGTVSDLQETFLGGFSEQYILSGYFQTADFGSFLLCAVLLFERNRIPAASGCLLLAAVMHAAYVAPAAVLAIIFLLYDIMHSRGEAAQPRWLRWGILALCLVALASISIFLEMRFAPTDPQSHHEARRIITHLRIPHHADPWRWIDINVLLQFGACCLAIWLLPRGRYRFVIMLGTAAIALFTLGAFLPNTDTYRLVAPWRLSVVIVPLSVFAIAAISVIRLKERGFFDTANAKRLIGGSLGVIFVCTAIGAALTAYKQFKPHEAYVDYVRANLASGQLYLTAPGAMNFRLATGVPHYVSYKTHPYQDVEVLEWYRRLQIANTLYRGKAPMDCGQIRRLAVEEKVTHMLVLPRDPQPSCDFLNPVFQDGQTKIYRLAAR